MISHRTADIYLDDDGDIWFKFKEKIEITLDDSKEYVNIIADLSGGIKRCVILDARGTYASSTKESRIFMGTDEEALRWRKADAILFDALHIRLLGNFYMKQDTPNYPVRMFKNEIKAKEWFRNIR